MPTYTYKCSICGEGFTMVRRFDERKTANCPTCGGDAVKTLCANDVPLDVNVMGDKFRNIQTKRDLNKIMEERSKQHYHEHEAAEVREKFGAENVVEDKAPKKKEVLTK